MSRFAPAPDSLPLDWALWYVGALGWRIFPLQPRAKTPLTPTGLHAATDDLSQIKKWWSANPRAGIGIPAGVNGLVIVDFDPRHGGEASYKQLLKEYARWQETAHVRSGGADRGLHFYFRSEEPWHQKTILPGVDVRAGASYVVAPPSIHPNTGKRYEWLVLP